MHANESDAAPHSRLPITVIVPVKNEERNLPACLESVRFADQVIVVDSASVDRTALIADDMGAEVVQFKYRPGGPRKKNWALDQAPMRNEWVLILDADERITPELESEIRRLFADGPRHRGYYLNRKHVFLGRWLRYGGNYPSWNLRLLRRGAGRYERLGTEDLPDAGDVEVHEHIRLDGPAGRLRAPMLHEDFKDLSQFIDRHNRYSTWDARMRERLRNGDPSVDAIDARFWGDPVERKRWLKSIWVRLPARPLLRFVYMYVLRLGFLDGRPGFLYAAFKAIQEFHISAKMYEQRLRRQGRGAPADAGDGWSADSPEPQPALCTKVPTGRGRAAV